MRFKVGDRVQIKSLDWYNENINEIDEIPCGNTVFIPDMVQYISDIVTISEAFPTLGIYRIKEDSGKYNWTDEMIEGLMKEEMSLDKAGQITDFEYDGLAYALPDGYQFVDDNGNEIFTSKIILKKKKKEYPKTYEECEKVLRYDSHRLDNMGVTVRGYKWELIRAFQILLICRDAYWKIAGEEMGLGKPWEPDWLDDDTKKYVITSSKVFETFGGLGYINYILTFPIEEMRDAFYEAFRNEIEFCKEFL